MRLGQDERGYAMAALLVGMSVAAVMLSVAMPVWSHATKREREEELIWRGQQYARAIGLFQRKYANTFPPNIDVLVEQRFLRRKYKDPITKEDFQPIPAGALMPGLGGPALPGGAAAGPIQPGAQMPGPGALPGATPAPGGLPGAAQLQAPGIAAPSIGIQGVVSKSRDSSIRVYNGRTKYNEWVFVHMVAAQRIGPGGPMPAQPGPPGTPGAPGAPGSFTPLIGIDRRPGVGGPPGGGAGSPFPAPAPRPTGPGPSRPPG